MAEREPPTNWKPTDDALSYLDFLSDDLFNLPGETLDPSTVEAAAACTVHTTDSTSSHCRKRSRETEVDPDADIKEDPAACLDDGEDERCADRKCGGKGVSEAAKNKACREKARRERINGSFTELAKLVDPGKEPKTDKSSILSDAIRVVQQLRVENNQLRQLNKFLEERVSQYERGRGQQLFQLASMHAQPAAAMAGPLSQPTGSLAPQFVTGVPCPPGAASTSTMPAAISAFGFPLPQPAAAAAAADPQSTTTGPLTFLGKPLVAGLPQPPHPHWLPPGMLDSTQDSLLRPPAA